MPVGGHILAHKLQHFGWWVIGAKILASTYMKPRSVAQIERGTAGSYFLAALTFAQRALCAAAIRLRPAADMVRFFPADLATRR